MWSEESGIILKFFKYENSNITIHITSYHKILIEKKRRDISDGNFFLRKYCLGIEPITINTSKIEYD